MGRTATRGGFTLVEILIVVVMIGIMAGIVVPRFNNVVREVRSESLKEQLREVRTIVQLYRLQHVDAAPNLNGSDWTDLTQAKPNSNGITCEPYLKSVPRNPMNYFSELAVVNFDQNWGDPIVGANVGFVLHSGTGMVWATNTAGNMIYNEDDPNDPNKLMRQRAMMPASRPRQHLQVHVEVWPDHASPLRQVHPRVPLRCSQRSRSLSSVEGRRCPPLRSRAQRRAAGPSTRPPPRPSP